MPVKIKHRVYERYPKRTLDFTLALLFLIMFWWLLVILALMVKAKLGSPVLFKQQRPGKDERIFTLYKFRSMTDVRDANGKPLSDEVRLTEFGKKLRSSSLDELPEILNILKGDMSFVGPRPLLTDYLNLYDNQQRMRHLVRPGLTGLAQVNGRNALSWEERFDLDLEYVERCSFVTDMSILVKSIKTVFLQEGIDSGTSVTMEPFRGSSKQHGCEDKP